MTPPPEPPVYRYAVEPMPPSRIGRRWRWELFDGERMLAAGWRLSERRAIHAVRTAAAREVHEALGLEPLRPERFWPETSFHPGTTVRLEAGLVACVLTPRHVARRRATPATAAA